MDAILNGLNNVCNCNSQHPPDIGGIQNLMEGLSNALLIHGPVKFLPILLINR